MTTVPPTKPRRLVLRLYVAGQSPNSILARANLDAALAALGDDSATLEVCDVLRDPARALKERVLVTPTLIRVSPQPELRVIGNLSDRQALLAGLFARGGAS
jgi:circadian clock protein KaiB